MEQEGAYLEWGWRRAAGSDSKDLWSGSRSVGSWMEKNDSLGKA